MKYVAVLDKNTGIFYIDNIKEIIIEDDLGMCLISLPSGTRVICKQEWLFDDIMRAYDFIYNVNRL